MSRTDKDLPHWMLAKMWEPMHRSCQYSILRRGRRECDLPDSPVIERPSRIDWSNEHTQCCWIPTWDYYDRPYGPRGVPTWFVRLKFTGPDRAKVRDECREALKEYNGNGEVDVVPSTTQHRHMARWSWW